ncbi:unnamed protein product [Closterium sp. Naga37s-1]|nr:unnamed protein product [Closterium sp. Naga37s-1]
MATALSVTHSVATASTVTHSKTTDCRPIGRNVSIVVLAPAVNNSSSNTQPTLHSLYSSAEQQSDTSLKEKVLPPDFLRTAAGLSSLLIASALRLNSTRYGFDSYVLGLGASVGVSVWSGEWQSGLEW